jgi:hypothetical protein
MLAYGRKKSLQFCRPTQRPDIKFVTFNCNMQRQPGKAAGQGSRARQSGKAVGQGSRARLPGKAAGQGCWARLTSKAAGQGCRAKVYAMVKLDNN